MLCVGCSTRAIVDAGTESGVDAAGEASDCPFCFDASPPPYDGAPNWPDAIAPPPESCDDAGMCALPPSICASPHALEYFDDAVCVDGGCTFTIKFAYCDECVDAGCVIVQTTPPPPTAP